MCRMVGLVATRAADNDGAAFAAPIPSWQHLVGAPHSLRIQATQGAVPPGDESGHDDSWGVGWFDGEGRVSLVRQTGSAADSAFFVFAAEGASRGGAGSGPAHVLLGHLRKASCGAITSENAHPVRADYGEGQTLLVAHNGTIRPRLLSVLRDELAATERDEARSDSDTVVLAGWLAERMSRGKPHREESEYGDPIFATMTGALRELLWHAKKVSAGDIAQVYSAINLLIAHPAGLFALRQFSKEPDYYTLFARPFAGDEGEGWLVSSEMTDDSPNWEPLTPGLINYYPVQWEAGHQKRTAWVQKP